MNNLISVIIPVYNVEQYLRQCLDSVTNQTYKKLEIILIDDGSTDNSGKICDEYALKDNRIKVIHQKNAGVSNARNIGLKNTQGEYISFIDSDDTVDTKMYEYLFYVTRGINFDLIKYRYEKIVSDRVIENNLDSTNIKILDTEELINNFVISSISKMGGSVWTSLFKREIIFRNNIFFDEKMRQAEDYIFFINYILCCKKIVLYNKSLYNYRKNFSSAVQTITYKTFMENLQIKLNLLENIIKNVNYDYNSILFKIKYLEVFTIVLLLEKEKSLYSLSNKIDELKKALKIINISTNQKCKLNFLWYQNLICYLVMFRLYRTAFFIMKVMIFLRNYKNYFYNK